MKTFITVRTIITILKAFCLVINAEVSVLKTMVYVGA